MKAVNTQFEQPIIETRGLCKNFGPTVALDHVDMQIYRGRITGLIGENGSGKSTITSILAGMQPPTSGEMFYKGQPHKPHTMLEAGKMGIGMIVQEQGYVPGITIAQNIFLGEEGRFRRAGFISRRAMNGAAQEILTRIGFTDVDAGMYIDALDLQDRKLVEIARVMAGDPEVLIVDETTTALSQRGRELIYDIMRRMRDDNKAVIFISHDLDELIGICDTLAVLRDGRLIATMEQAEFDVRKIKRCVMSGGKDFGVEFFMERYTGIMDALNEFGVKVDYEVPGWPDTEEFAAHQTAALETVADGLAGTLTCGCSRCRTRARWARSRSRAWRPCLPLSRA